MGYIRYGDARIEIMFDDRVLAHIQVVVIAKLRRKEGFFFTWRDDPANGDGRSSIWMSCGIPLVFHWDNVARVELNREWLEELGRSANSAQGLFLTDEPGQPITRPMGNVVGTPHHLPNAHTKTAPNRRPDAVDTPR